MTIPGGFETAACVSIYDQARQETVLSAGLLQSGPVTDWTISGLLVGDLPHVPIYTMSEDIVLSLTIVTAALALENAKYDSMIRGASPDEAALDERQRSELIAASRLIIADSLTSNLRVPGDGGANLNPPRWTCEQFRSEFESACQALNACGLALRIEDRSHYIRRESHHLEGLEHYGVDFDFTDINDAFSAHG